MVDWKSSAELLKDADAFSKIIHFLLGVYIWEWANTVNFEYAIVTGRQRFRWPLVFYFYGRYAMFGGLIGFVIALNETTTRMNCSVLYTFLQFLGNTALGAASINLSIRTIAIYSQKLSIVIPISVIILGHWVIILWSVTNVKATWIDGSGCAITSSNPKLFVAMYVYSMGFDFIVMCLMAYKLGFVKRNQHRSQIVQLMFIDGLGYFLTAFLVNLVAVVFSVLNLNSILSIIADAPASTLATIVSCRVVRRLYQFQRKGVDIYSHNTSSGLRSGRQNNVSTSHRTANEVHVQMNTFVRSDVSYDPPAQPKADEDANTSSEDIKHQL
ncbi:uncharacterized protein EV420DRAFT_1568081 [Desarmillaria tabescens]|uniref:Uncharacterized protein n=1 Tax=Armillaria tabescens TaxID=1929756 RepID=A0AA39JWH3_ARMTA|nr:uncharacterized protein EV420DRAFT_1568081 [Desarmillaria tabescens]KAK0447883.1 hypothetical protein EV420DRAFT_1568081 [Desarmillaria tabescens]